MEINFQEVPGVPGQSCYAKGRAGTVDHIDSDGVWVQHYDENRTVIVYDPREVEHF